VQEQKYVDDFGRMDNIRKLSKACTKLLTVVNDCAAEPAAAAPAAAGVAQRVVVRRTYKVCVPKALVSFGTVTGPRPTGVTVTADGICTISEFAGNDDGFFQPDAGDGHEPEFKEAVNVMIGAKGCVGEACVGLSEEKKARKNRYLNSFLRDLNNLAGTKDYDYATVRFCSLRHCAFAPPLPGIQAAQGNVTSTSNTGTS
jgi:hypothetical protein